MKYFPVMKYINETVRRQDRLLDESRSRELLKTSEYGVLSMVDDGGLAYGIPGSFIWDGDDRTCTTPPALRLKKGGESLIGSPYPILSCAITAPSRRLLLNIPFYRNVLQHNQSLVFITCTNANLKLLYYRSRALDIDKRI